MVTLAIDIGGSGARALLDDAPQDLRESQDPHTSDGTGAEFRELRWNPEPGYDEPGQVVELARTVLGGRIPDAVAVSFPGSLDASGAVERWPNRPWWTGVALTARLDFGPPPLVDDDAYLAACAEFAARPDARMEGLFYLGLGTGVGGAWAPPGAEPVRCEPGHLIIRPDGARCTCGRRGCLQAYLPTAEAAWALAIAIADLAEICAFRRLVVGGGKSHPALLQAVSELLPQFTRPGTDLPRPESARYGPGSSLHGALLAARRHAPSLDERTPM